MYRKTVTFETRNGLTTQIAQAETLEQLFHGIRYMVRHHKSIYDNHNRLGIVV